MKLKYLLPMASSMLLLSGTAFAVPADDVVCVSCIQATDLANGAVTTAKLRGSAVKFSKLANGAVRTSKIGFKAVTSAKIADGAVKSGKLGF